MRTFGCESFVHIDKYDRTKLEAKSKKCTFIGYGIDDFGNFLWDDWNHKIIRSRYVIFNENVIYKDPLHNENTEYTVLDEIKENEVPKAPRNQEKQHVPQTRTNVRRYSKLSRPPKQFSP